jgi:hypothetical protein
VCLCCYHLHTQQYEKARAVADKLHKERRTSSATAATRRDSNATDAGNGDEQQQEGQALEDDETEPVSAASWAARVLLVVIVHCRMLWWHINLWHLVSMIVIVGLAITMVSHALQLVLLLVHQSVACSLRKE